MNTSNRQLDALGIPVWISHFCNQHQTLHLSDTRTYRLLMVIYRSIIEMRVHPNESEADQEEKVFGFMTWFLRLGSSLPAVPGLMWIHQEIGKKLMASECAGAVADDERLSRMLMAFIVLSGVDSDDPLAEIYHGMIGEGWGTFGHEEDKDSLYCGFLAALVTHSNQELVALGKRSGIAESKLKKAMRRISNRSGSLSRSSRLETSAVSPSLLRQQVSTSHTDMSQTRHEGAK